MTVARGRYELRVHRVVGAPHGARVTLTGWATAALRSELVALYGWTGADEVRAPRGTAYEPWARVPRLSADVEGTAVFVALASLTAPAPAAPPATAVPPFAAVPPLSSASPLPVPVPPPAAVPPPGAVPPSAPVPLSAAVRGVTVTGRAVRVRWADGADTVLGFAPLTVRMG
ncbi:hypothetical protein GCM10018785_17900 [Streptomyces longispororuber]|uniref:Uncharacterized protein n=1 Tax=Streptomyces longispororuber TaxID=68230 RepID=A0A918ZEC9_9ACTN|nr:hypothetical protein GCM10018785_17900 [Streptomyces longispororuber]